MPAAGPVRGHRLLQDRRGGGYRPVLRPAQGPVRLRLLHRPAPAAAGGVDSHPPPGQARPPAPRGGVEPARAHRGRAPPDPVPGGLPLVAGAVRPALDLRQVHGLRRRAGGRAGHGLPLRLHPDRRHRDPAGPRRHRRAVRPAAHPQPDPGLPAGAAGTPPRVRPGGLPGAGAAPEVPPPGAGASALPPEEARRHRHTRGRRPRAGQAAHHPGDHGAQEVLLRQGGGGGGPRPEGAARRLGGGAPRVRRRARASPPAGALPGSPAHPGGPVPHGDGRAARAARPHALPRRSRPRAGAGTRPGAAPGDPGAGGAQAVQGGGAGAGPGGGGPGDPGRDGAGSPRLPLPSRHPAEPGRGRRLRQPGRGAPRQPAPPPGRTDLLRRQRAYRQRHSGPRHHPVRAGAGPGGEAEQDHQPVRRYRPGPWGVRRPRGPDTR